MRPQHLVTSGKPAMEFDAALPQPAALGEFSCQFGYLWAIVHPGRTQAAYIRKRGPAVCEVLQEIRSRGCRALKSPFLPFAWWPLLPLAPRKQKKSSMSKIRLLRLNQPTPASTSDLKGRARRVFQARPALFMSAMPPATAQAKSPAASAHFPTILHQLFALAPASLYVGATVTDSSRRISCGSRPLSPCWRLPLSLLAPNLRLRQSRCLPSPKSPFRTANTAPELTGWACRVDPVAPVRHMAVSPAHSPAQEVHLC